MADGSVTTGSIDYLQRVGALPDSLSPAGVTAAVETRRLVRVRGVGRPDKEWRPQPWSPAAWRPRTAELITGLYGYRIPLVFVVSGTSAGVSIQLGTWSARAAVAGAQERRMDVISSVLRGLYPAMELESVHEPAPAWPLTGLALGVPAPAGLDQLDGSAPLDRVIRSMAGRTWAVQVLAYPVAEGSLGDLRSGVLNEMRAIEAAAKSEGAPSPLAEQYVELLKTHLAALGEGLATGAWRTAVYLLGDASSYPCLATAWRSVFSGERSLPEPVRVFDRPEAQTLAATWTLPDQAPPPGPGYYQRPFEFQTLLTTAQLALYAHLPELETPGFSVQQVPRFDSVPIAADRAAGLAVGRVLQQRRDTGTDYRVALASLRRHVFVAGMTGSGKTNTIFSLLMEADAADIPFLVIEPAKTEYRSLLDHPRLGARMRVFTAGKSAVAPFLLNPFEVPAGTTVSEHLDLVRAAFSAAFGLWTPLPQVLERCLHEVYRDRGWDLRTDQNVRLTDGSAAPDSFPTLADLASKVEEVVPALGYEERITSDIRAALSTRLDSLRSGGKGAMLDVSRSIPVAELLAGPAVLELEAMGDEGDKAFLTALVLIRLAEHRRAVGQTPGLAHLLVIEEAHRLLGNVPTQAGEEMANPRGQAVETFTNLLSEIRAYGQGVIIADQVPVRLAPDVVKNTNLKIAHQTVSADDRAALGGAMAMEAAQTAALTTLGVGEAAVFSTGDDGPLLIRVPLVKDVAASAPPRDEAVARHMSGWEARAGLHGLYLPRPFCAETCAGAPAACAAARRLLGDEYLQRTVARTVLSMIEQAGALERLWPDLTSVLRARRPPLISEAELMRAFAGHAADWYAAHRGAQNVWPYLDTQELSDRLRAVLWDRVAGGDAAVSAQLREAFQTTARRLHLRQFEPYPVCEQVCSQEPPLCLYRSAVADLVAARRYQASWKDADAADAGDADNRRRQTWEVCQDAAFEVIEFPDQDTVEALRPQLIAAARRVCLCFEQQMLAADTRKVPRTSRRILARVLTEAGM